MKLGLKAQLDAFEYTDNFCVILQIKFRIK